jgi:hypothetical protein
MRLSKQTSAVWVLVLCAGAGVGCGGASGTNVLVGSTYGGSVHLVIEDGAGSGVAPSHVPATVITVLAQDPASGAVAVFVGGYVDEGNGFSAKRWQVQFAVDSTPKAGNVYSIMSTQNTTLPNTDAVLSFEEDSNELGDWLGDSGTISVTLVEGNVATFEVSMADMAPMSGSGATGPFTFNGEIVVDLSNLCNCSD